MDDAPGHIEFVHRSWPADPAQLSVIRHQLARWLAPLRLTEEETAAVVLAVDEAAANAVRHAYVSVDAVPDHAVPDHAAPDHAAPDHAAPDHAAGPDRPETVELTLWTEPGTLSIEVVDHGSWRPPEEEPAVGGRGIGLMSTMSESVLIHYDDRGSRVLLRHRIPVR